MTAKSSQVKQAVVVVLLGTTVCSTATLANPFGFSPAKKLTLPQAIAAGESTPVADPQAAASKIDQRLLQLRGVAAIALSRRMITPTQASGFRRQIDYIQAQDTKAKRTGLTDANTSYILSLITMVTNNLNSQLGLNQALHQGSTPPVTVLSNLENQRLFLANRITEGVKLGRLSDQQAREFRSELNRIVYMERQPDGLTPSAQANLRRSLSQLNARIAKFM